MYNTEILTPAFLLSGLSNSSKKRSLEDETPSKFVIYMGRNFEESVFKYYYLGYGPFKLNFDADFSRRAQTPDSETQADPDFTHFDTKYSGFTDDASYDDVGFIGAVSFLYFVFKFSVFLGFERFPNLLV